MQRKFLKSLSCWGIGACLTPAVLAQVDEPRRDEPAARPVADNPEVYVNDSFEASDALNKAETLVQRGRWSEAAQLLQRAVDRSAHRLVRIEPGSYTGIRRHVADRIARWPRPGIEEYRRLYERDAEAAWAELSESRSVDELLPLFERYFCTAAAAKLADVIGQLAIEAGDLPLAEYVYRRVLERHPDSTAYASRCRAVLSVLAAMRGQSASESPDDAARLRWMGQERSVRDVVEEIGRTFTRDAEVEPASTWPTFGGNSARSRATTCTVDEPGLLWRFDWLASGDADPKEDTSSPRELHAERDPTIFPVVAERLLVAQWFREVVALHQVTGAVAWRFGRNPTRVGELDYLDDAAPDWDSPTIQDGRVYAAMPGDDSPFSSFDSPKAVSELVCLDLKTGRPIWRISPRFQDDPQAEITFDSAPVLRDGSLYIAGRRRRTFGFEDAYLYRIQALDGTIKMRTHVGSASTGSSVARSATRSVIALQGDRAYVCTNLGSVAAVSVHTGDVLWLRLYERTRTDAASPVGRSAQTSHSWGLNSPMWSDGRLVCLPMDSNRLLLLSAEDGKVLRAVPVNRLAHVESVFGLRGDLLCGVGEEAFCFDLGKDEMRWTAPLPGGSRLLGRGQWVGDELWAPRRRGISRFKTADGTRIDAPWDAEGEGGNVLAMSDQLFVAGAGRISAYVRKADIWNALRNRMAAAPRDPVPAIELAEASLGAGEYAEALSALDQAVKRAQGSQALDPPLQARFVEASLKFAQTLARRSLLDAESLDRLNRYAEQFANDPEMGVRYRLAFAGWFETSEKPDRALRLYQQLLKDRSLREIVPPQDAGGPRRGAEIAEDRIAKLLATQGRSIYAPFEAEAKQWLDAARTAADPAMLQRLIDSFPNSESAPRALVAQGDALVRQGKVDAAARQFGKALHRYPDFVDRPALLRKIADTYAQGGMHEPAYRWLTKAARDYPGERIEIEGRLVSFAQYRDRLRGPRLRVEPSRPVINLPLDGTFEIDVHEDAALLRPRFSEHPRADWSRFFVRAGRRIQAFVSKSGTPLWETTAPTGGPAELLFAGDDAVVFAAPHRIFALNAKDGALRWSDPADETVGDPGADWEAGGGVLRFHDLQGDRLVSVREDGRISCLAIDSGKRVWSQGQAATPTGGMHLAAPWVVYALTKDDHGVIALLDAENGDRIDTITTDQRRPIEELFVTLDGQVVAVTTQAVTAFDVESRKQTWSKNVPAGIKPASLVVDVDVLFFVGEDGELRKMSLDDGRMLWLSSERVMERNEEELTVQLQEGMLIVSTTQSVTAVDTVDGQTLWTGTTPEKCRLVARAVTASHVVAIDLLDGLRPGRSAAYFYEHRNQSGLIPKSGGAPDLGPLDEIRTVLALDDAIVIQTGTKIRGYGHK